MNFGQARLRSVCEGIDVSKLGGVGQLADSSGVISLPDARACMETVSEFSGVALGKLLRLFSWAKGLGKSGAAGAAAAEPAVGDRHALLILS